MMSSVPMTVEGGVPDRGASPKCFLHDASGGRYLFKPTLNDEDLTACASQLAMALRQAADEPHVNVARRVVPGDDGAPMEGLVSPWIQTRGVLPCEASAWSPGQQAQILADAPWFELLGNYDTRPDQYVVLPDGNISNIDWDHTGRDHLHDRRLDRFKADNPTPPAQNLLYQAYVRGQIDLDFTPMFEAIERIEAIPEQELTSICRAFAREAYSRSPSVRRRFASPEAYARAFLERRSNLRTRFRRLVADLRQERSGRQSGEVRLDAYPQDAWMDLAAALLRNEAVMKPAFSAVRGLHAALGLNLT
jgi:hypothetical protein